LQAVLDLLAAAAQTLAPVYLQGESGTGKEGLARFVHERSGRRKGPWVAVNCGALSPSLLEAELFGSVKGAFTGSTGDRPGKVRQAEGGTLFLDEIGDMPLEAQTRLLRVLQERRVMPVGGDREVPVDFRLVCATHQDLRQRVAEGRFREDLFFRLHVVPVHVPPLRDRPGDIPGLLRLFLAESLTPQDADQAMAALPSSLTGYVFPGNVRELRNMAQRLAVQALLRPISAETWREVLTDRKPNAMPVSSSSAQLLPSARMPTPARHSTTQRACPTSRLSDSEIRQTLEAVGWHRAQAANRLGISRRALQYRLARWQREEAAQYI
jgi:two-component system response regulator PilR (NtrC family)